MSEKMTFHFLNIEKILSCISLLLLYSVVIFKQMEAGIKS